MRRFTGVRLESNWVVRLPLSTTSIGVRTDFSGVMPHARDACACEVCAGGSAVAVCLLCLSALSAWPFAVEGVVVLWLCFFRCTLRWSRRSRRVNKPPPFLLCLSLVVDGADAVTVGAVGMLGTVVVGVAVPEGVCAAVGLPMLFDWTSFHRSKHCRGSLLLREGWGAEDSTSDMRSQFVPKRFTARRRTWSSSSLHGGPNESSVPFRALRVPRLYG